ncbi:MAG: alpha/beta hydrolase [Alicyclobacillus sp.]|nr:alpha/beta hydrolase [Alicyclobacillus sp.]
MKPIHEEIVHIQATYKLEGALSIPTVQTSGLPAALLIHGAGKGTLRDGMRDIAHCLSASGFVTLRYDKRGIGNSEGNFEATGLWDFVEDAIQCLEFIRNRSEVDRDRIIIVGNSEGSMIAVAVNAKVPVQGLILLVPNIQPLLHLQLRQLPISYEQLRQQRGFTGSLEELEQAQRSFADYIIQSTDDTIKAGDTVVPAKWVREHYAYDVRKDLPHVKCPTLVISGGKDLFCDPLDAQRIAELVSGECEYHIIPDMTHTLRCTDEPVDHANVVAIHSKQWRQPVDAKVRQLIEKWVMRHFT